MAYNILTTACFVFVCLIPSAYGQIPTPGDIQAIIPQQDLIIEQETQRRNEFERSIRALDPPKTEEEPKDDDSDEDQEDGACIQIDRIELTGATLLDDGGQDALLSDFAPSCMTLSTMDDVIARVSNWYLDSGYVTTRAYLTPQDLASGVLSITVIEGKVGDIALYESGTRQSQAKTAILPVHSSELLNIRHIEQGLDQINRLRSKDATVKLHPANQPGLSDVEINTQEAFPLTFNSYVDNSGQENTGVSQAALDVTAEDMLGLYEQIRLSTKHDLAASQKSSQSFSGFISIPYGNWTASWSSTFFAYESALSGLNQSFSSTGNTRTHTAEVQRLIHRDQDSKTSLSASIGLKDTRNYIADVFIPVSSRKLSVGTLRLQHSGRLGSSVLSLSGSYHQGLSAFGALKDPDGLAHNTPKAQFSKWAGHIGFTRPQLFSINSLNLDNQLHFQYSPDTLYPTESLALGGLYTVRGFRDQSISGDSGLYGRSQLSYWALIDESISWQHYLAMDAGWIRPQEGRVGRGALAGATVGTMVTMGLISAHCAFEQPLLWPKALTRNEAPIIYAKLGIRLPF